MLKRKATNLNTGSQQIKKKKQKINLTNGNTSIKSTVSKKFVQLSLAQWMKEKPSGTNNVVVQSEEQKENKNVEILPIDEEKKNILPLLSSNENENQISNDSKDEKKIVQPQDKKISLQKEKKKRKYANPLKNQEKLKDIKNSTIVLSLHHSLHPNRTKEEKNLFIKKLNEAVYIFSRLRHETTLYANYVALRSIEDPISYPLSFAKEDLRLFFCHCMDRVMGKKIGEKKSKQNSSKKSRSKKSKKPKTEKKQKPKVRSQINTLNKLDWPRSEKLPNYRKLLTGL